MRNIQSGLSLLVLSSLAITRLLQAQTPPKRAAALAEYSAAIEELIDSASPSVVQIDVHSRVAVDSDEGRRTGFFAKQWGSGSGVIIEPSGFILTNSHVIEGSSEIDVSVADTSNPAKKDAHNHFPAKVVGFDKETDLAVIKIETPGGKLPTLAFRDSDKLRQGEIVFALGSPLGLQNTLTVGYISAPSRQLDPEKAMSYIQTDAPINPGNSGGPLLDADGKIAGINTMIYSKSGGSEGIGFAIPANVAQHVYRELRKEGHVHRGTIGVISQDINPIMSQALGLNRHPGVIIADLLPHGSGEAAGLEANDIVLAVQGREVTEARQVQAEILQHSIGDQVTLDILRNGSEKLQKTVVILERPNSSGGLVDLVNNQSNLVRRLGILALTLDEKVTPLLPPTRRLDGVVVAAIPIEFAAFNPGLKTGDIIYSLNKSKVGSLEDLRNALKATKPGDPIAMLVERDGTLGYVSFNLE